MPVWSRRRRQLVTLATFALSVLIWVWALGHLRLEMAITHFLPAGSRGDIPEILHALTESELARTTSHQRSLALLIIDLDHFKSVNDLYGHPAGDIVLKLVGASLQANARGEFIVARIGGEEFAAVLPEQDVSEAAAFAERLRGAIEALELDASVGPRKVTVSIGVAAWQPGMAGVADLLRTTDAELYRAKEDGRNRVCVAR